MQDILPIDRMLPLVGLGPLCEAAKGFRFPEGPGFEKPAAEIQGVLDNALYTIEFQLAPHEPAHTLNHTYGLVAAASRCALRAVIAPDGSPEYHPILAPRDKFLSLKAWVAGIAFGYNLDEVDDLRAPAPGSSWRDGMYFTLVGGIPRNTGELGRMNFLLVPVLSSRLYDPRPRMN